jgi:crotonobetainyl-CoA:carnitine CoA-transferase CaiB-like acyl-CoA transferase
MGADVIKVERPGSGDDIRSWGPPFLKDKDGKAGDAGYFLAVNRGKRSITVDLNTPRGQKIVRELAKRSDILLENYKVGTLAKFGLSYDALKKVNPRLIYCSVTGFGQTGPRKDAAAYDFMIQALGGLMSVTGERDDLPGGGPQKVGVPIVDIMTGMYTAVAVLAALARRDQTGKGDFIDIGMLDVMVSFLLNQSMNYLLSGKVPQRNGNRHPNIQPQDVYATSNGHMVLAVGNDGQFEKLCAVMGRPELATDERFATNAGRVRNLPVLSAIIRESLAQRETATWVELLEAAGVPSGPINTIPDVFKDPQVVHRQMLIELPHPTAGSVPSIASPMRFQEAPISYEKAPPLVGQHSEEILRELGLSEDEVPATAATQAS